MSTSDILASLPKLTPEERDTVRLCLDEIDSSAPATPEEQRIIAERIAAYRQSPDSAIEWRAAEDEIRTRLGL